MEYQGARGQGFSWEVGARGPGSPGLGVLLGSWVRETREPGARGPPGRWGAGTLEPSSGTSRQDFILPVQPALGCLAFFGVSESGLTMSLRIRVNFEAAEALAERSPEGAGIGFAPGPSAVSSALTEGLLVSGGGSGVLGAGWHLGTTVLVGQTLSSAPLGGALGVERPQDLGMAQGSPGQGVNQDGRVQPTWSSGGMWSGGLSAEHPPPCALSLQPRPPAPMA